MPKADSYFSIIRPASGILKEKGSKFLAFTYPVRSETEIKDQLTLLRREHPSANHHCYAWRLGADKELYRANDDGEPSNSAGKPILSVIQANDLSDVLIVVVRYFGGTLLGVNGLINAYKDAATEAISAAEIVEHFVMMDYRVEFEMKNMNVVMRILKEYDVVIISNSYEEKNILIFRVKKQKVVTLEARFKELYTVTLQFLENNTDEKR